MGYAAVAEDQLTEVLVACDEYRAPRVGERQDGVIRDARFHFADSQNLVTVLSEALCDSLVNALVQQKYQPEPLLTG